MTPFIATAVLSLLAVLTLLGNGAETQLVPSLIKTLPASPADVSPVPPCAGVIATVNPDSLVISLLMPVLAAPNAALASSAVFLPVPPFAIATTPDTLSAVPVIFESLYATCLVAPLILLNCPRLVIQTSPFTGDSGVDPGVINNPLDVAVDAAVVSLPVNTAPTKGNLVSS